VKNLRLAVIGAGRLGGFHAQNLAGMRGVELVGVVDPLAQARLRVAAECNTRALDDHRPLLDRIDAAVVAAPTMFHHAVGRELLDHGIHVLMEKPLCPTLRQADDLVKTARRKNLVLQVGHVERFNPALPPVLACARDPKYIEAVRSSGFTFRSTDIGVVLDLMIHDLDLVLSMVGSRVRNVEALGLSVLGGHEDVAHARLEFESGCVANFSASRVSYEPVRRMQVWSARAFARVDFAARRTTLVRPSETLLRREFDVNGLSPEQMEHYKRHLLQEHLPREDIEAEPVDALTLELGDFIDSIRTSQVPRVTGEQARDAVAVAERILSKIGTHAWNNAPDGPSGPMAAARPSVVPAPHWTLSPIHSPVEHREAS